MKPITAWVMALIFAGSAGAASGNTDIDAAIAAAKTVPACCRTPAAMTFISLQPGATTFALDEKSPAFAFEPSGKSYFAAFKLPIGNSFQLRVRSSIFQKAPQGAALFFPRILLLNGSKIPLSTVSWADDILLHPGEAGGPDYIETVADLSAYPSARFMIVYTDAGRAGAMENLQHLVPESAVTAPVNGTSSHVFFVEVPDPHLDPFLTTPVRRSPVAPGSLVIDIRSGISTGKPD